MFKYHKINPHFDAVLISFTPDELRGTYPNEQTLSSECWIKGKMVIRQTRHLQFLSVPLGSNFIVLLLQQNIAAANTLYEGITWSRLSFGVLCVNDGTGKANSEASGECRPLSRFHCWRTRPQKRTCSQVNKGIEEHQPASEVEGHLSPQQCEASKHTPCTLLHAVEMSAARWKLLQRKRDI